MDRLSFLRDRAPFALEVARARPEALRDLRERMAALGYTEQGLLRTLGLAAIHERRSGWIPIWTRWFLRRDDPGHALVRLFFFGLEEDAGVLAAGLGREALALLRDLRLVTEVRPGRLRSPIKLYPIAGLLVVTDWSAEPDPTAAREPSRVMYLGKDSCGLVRLVASTDARRVLDLCTGSGVAALAAAARGATVIGVDVNDRAVHFARLNAMLGGLEERCRFEVGDLFAPVGDERFDLVTANPPFVPGPTDDALLFRGGGPAGDAVLSRIVEGCAAHLERPALAIVATDFVHQADRPYETKLRSWLRELVPCSALVLEDHGMDPYGYALEHLRGTTAGDGWIDTLHAWIALYRAEGIERIGSGYLAVRAERAGDALKTFVLPMQSTLDTALPEGWLSAAFHRLSSWREGPDDARVVLDADLVGVDVSSDGSPVAGTSMPFVLAAVLQPAGETGMTLDEIARAIESQGFEMDAERRAELRESLVQLHVAGFLRLR